MALRCTVLGIRVVLFGLSLSAFVSFGMPGSGEASGRNEVDACWSSDELRGGKAEEFIFGSSAYKDPPQGEPVPLPPRTERRVIRRVELPPGRKLIALTFDLCERPDEITGYEGGIVDFLRKEGIRATFFMGGKWMRAHEDRAYQLLSDPLFEVANHTWEHRNLRISRGQELIDEINKTQLIYQQVRDRLLKKKPLQCTLHDGTRLADRQIPDQLRLFRFPYGACDRTSLDTVAGLGLTAVQWDVSSGDPFFGQNARMMERDVLARKRPGSIVLFHANGRGLHTRAALPGIIKGLLAEGYKFVTVTQLIAAGKPVMDDLCYDVKRRDTDQYDDLARDLHEKYQKFKKSSEAKLPSTTGDENEEGLAPVPWLDLLRPDDSGWHWLPVRSNPRFRERFEPDGLALVAFGGPATTCSTMVKSAPSYLQHCLIALRFNGTWPEPEQQKR